MSQTLHQTKLRAPRPSNRGELLNMCPEPSCPLLWAGFLARAFISQSVVARRMADTEEIRGALLLDVAKEAFLKQVAKRVRPLSRSFVERWAECEFWLYSSVVQRHRVELHTFKPVILDVLRSTSIDDMIRICRETRPDLDDLWTTAAARAKLRKEIEKSIEAVSEA